MTDTSRSNTGNGQLTLTDSLGGYLTLIEGHTGALTVIVGDEMGNGKVVFLNIAKQDRLIEFLKVARDRR